MITLEELSEDMKDVLYQSYLESTKEAREKILKEFFEQKKSLIELFSKHPFWNPEKLYIVLNTTNSREINPEEILSFIYWFRLRTDGKFEEIYRRLSRHYEPTIGHQLAALINETYPEAKVRPEQKTNKVVGKLARILGVNTEPQYEAKYAKYSDALTPNVIDTHTILSLNPIDYLLSSNGNSWTSCHSIYDSDGGRGCYHSGSMSYMLDPSTFVLYQVDESYKGSDFELQAKVIRQMFHYSNGILVQGRLYPQDNDGKCSLYTPLRATVQEVISRCLDVSNYWVKRSGTEAASEHIVSCGTHYKDYAYNSNCNLSRLVSMIPEGTDNRAMLVGHKPMCLTCGDEHSHTDSLYCSSSCNRDERAHFCAECGQFINEDDCYYVDGDYYCNDCITYCDICEEYHRKEDCTYVKSENSYVCDECFNEYFVYCSNCDEIIRFDEAYETAHGYYVCRDCAENRYVEIDGELYKDNEVTLCSMCGEYFVSDGDDLCPDCRKEAEDER